jgi:hypothetical protein
MALVHKTSPRNRFELRLGEPASRDLAVRRANAIARALPGALGSFVGCFFKSPPASTGTPGIPQQVLVRGMG